MKLAHETVHGKMDKLETPSVTLVERIVSDIEEGEFVAVPLDEVTTREENDNEATLQPSLTREGILRMSQKSKLKVGLPRDTEEFRRRISILGNAIGFVKLKMSNHGWLKTVDPQVFDGHIRYILGDKVLKKRRRTSMA